MSRRLKKMKDISEIKEKPKITINQSVYGRLSVKHWNVEYFFKIIDEKIEDLLDHDICYKLADKYLIAMVFMYFLRASFRPEEYTRFNFFAALYLAHDMEEEDDDNRFELVQFTSAVGCPWSPRALYDNRVDIFKRMGYRAVVSRACCERLMCISNAKHPVWERQRYGVHAGANRSYDSSRNVCPNCIDMISTDSP